MRCSLHNIFTEYFILLTLFIIKKLLIIFFFPSVHNEVEERWKQKKGKNTDSNLTYPCLPLSNSNANAISSLTQLSFPKSLRFCSSSKNEILRETYLLLIKKLFLHDVQ